MDKVEPCPFCYGRAVIERGYQEDETGRRWWGKCIDPTCSTHGPIRRTRGAALEAWNHRPERERVLAAVREEYVDLMLAVGWECALDHPDALLDAVRKRLEKSDG